MLRTLGILMMTGTAAWAQSAATPRPAPGSAPASSSTLQQLLKIADVESELTELRKKYSDSHPEVLRMQNLLQQLRSRSTLPSLAPTYGIPQPVQAGSAPRFLPENWWRNAGIVAILHLTGLQVKQIEDTFQQSRIKLIDLNAALEKEEVMLEPLVAADNIDEAKLTAQIDRLAQARAELEKARGRMLVGIRKVLEPEQWRKLDEMGFKVTSR